MSFLTYLFWPNPGNADYSSLSVMVPLLVCAGFIVLSFLVRFWRKTQTNARTKKLSKSWSGVLLWFAVVGAVFAVSRAEQISFLSMRFLWVLWVLAFALYVFFQIRGWRGKHYEVIETENVEDPRDRYLPKKKK